MPVVHTTRSSGGLIEPSFLRRHWLAVLTCCLWAGSFGEALLLAQPSNPPTISGPSNLVVYPTAPPPVIALTVGDAETPADALVLTGFSSNPSVLGSTNIVFGGSGSNRTATLNFTPGAVGTSSVMVVVTDLSGLNAATTLRLEVSYFTDITPVFSGGSLFNPKWADYDNDGDLDLVIANGDALYLIGSECLLLENDGTGCFVDASSKGGAAFRTPVRGRGIDPGRRSASSVFDRHAAARPTGGHRRGGPRVCPRHRRVRGDDHDRREHPRLHADPRGRHLLALGDRTDPRRRRARPDLRGHCLRRALVLQPSGVGRGGAPVILLDFALHQGSFTLEIHEQSGPLAGIFRSLRQLTDEPRDALANHCTNVSGPGR